MDKRKVIIDTDCGSDDAVAIVMALRDNSVEVLFFTTVAGNIPVELATRNTLISIEAAKTYAPPVYEGLAQPLLRDLVCATETHGSDGLGDIGLDVKELKKADGNGVLKLLEALRKSDGDIEIIALGPLTNIAAAIILEPNTMRRVKRISIMGSAGFGSGNVTPLAEFNIWQDAEAAKIVVDFGVPLFIVGWDACLGEAILYKEDIDRLREGSDIGKFCIDINKTLLEMNMGRFHQPALDMADPAAMAAILYPDCIKECGEYACDVDTSKGISYGAVHIDRYGFFPDMKAKAEFCTALDGVKFRKYLYKTLL